MAQTDRTRHAPAADDHADDSLFAQWMPAYGAMRGLLLWLLLVGSVAACLYTGWLWLTVRQTNAEIASLLAGRNVEIDLTEAPSRLLAARGYYVLTRDRMPDAQAILDQASFRADDPDRADLLFNMANARMRAAYDFIDRGSFAKAISLVNLAKDEYRRALQLQPEAWDAKFNLAVAMRLVRDLPQAEAPADDEGEKPETRLWMELPGVPRGAP
ncbi:MxaK protein [Methyloligella halotolerans]|uniref:MxaK protein n=1 Tax=Methyloligella halotolerans TaxID=1177755 RepID=A0A1E2RWS4_9HYPH|nr:hypothetical protein [Methyloligella halotolerans]ODA66661.1 MxaK protein [Methyloligella halotolerans]